MTKTKTRLFLWHVQKWKRGCSCDMYKGYLWPCSCLRVYSHTSLDWPPVSPAGLIRRIHWLHLCRGIRLPPPHPRRVSWIWHQMIRWWGSNDAGALDIPSLPPLLGPLWLGVVAPDSILSIGQIELHCVLMLNWIVWNGTVFDIETVLTLNWIVWNRVDYLYKNGFGIK